MRHLKTFGLTAILGLALMALAGVGTASATTLSTDSAGTFKYGAGTSIEATLKSGTSSEWKTTGGSLIGTCTTSSFSGTISTATGAFVSGSVNWLTWGGCSQFTFTVFPGSFEFSKGFGDSASFWSLGTEVTFEIFGVSCTYGWLTSHQLGSVTGGEAPEISISANLSKTAGGFLCPGSATWTASYVVTSPHSLHFVS